MATPVRESAVLKIALKQLIQHLQHQINDEIEEPTTEIALNEPNLDEPNDIGDTFNKENFTPPNMSDVLLPFLSPALVRQ